MGTPQDRTSEVDVCRRITVGSVDILGPWSGTDTTRPFETKVPLADSSGPVSRALKDGWQGRHFRVNQRCAIPPKHPAGEA